MARPLRGDGVLQRRLERVRDSTFAAWTHAGTTWAGERSWLALCLLLALAPLAMRGPLPPDELRYLSVAWEMWSRGDFLVPHLNGAPYADKPPLLFWLMHVGWLAFGVNDWWPRVLPSLFALTSIPLAQALCRALWPTAATAIRVLPWLLLGSFAWTLYTQAVLFDLLLANCVLLGLLGLAHARRGATPANWGLVAVATALGLLAKGPAMLLYLAGPALLATWWADAKGFRARRWYGQLALAVLSGCLVAGAWAALAAARGGSGYAADILLDQTAGRLVDSFAHARPFWFYLYIVPVLLFPWSLWPVAWRATVSTVAVDRHDHGLRFLSAVIVPVVIAFSTMSGKQPHYMLPTVPLALIMLAVSLTARPPRAAASAALPVTLAASAAAAIALTPSILGLGSASAVTWAPGWGIAAIIFVSLLARPGLWPRVIKRLAWAAPIVTLTFEAGFFAANRAAYDARPAAMLIRELQAAGHPIGYVGKYDGEFHYPGRLLEPLQIIDHDTGAPGYREADDASVIEAWSTRHPNGYLIRYSAIAPVNALYTQRFRGRWVVIEPAASTERRADTTGF